MQSKVEKISDRLKEIAEKKEKLKFQERQLERLFREKSRKQKTKRMIEVGSIAANFGINAFDDEVITGAFAEIQEKAQHSPTLDEWRRKAQALEKTSLLRLIISFVKEPSDNLKCLLKEKNFRCNKWRKEEWFGQGLKEEIENLVKEHQGKVEIVKG